jgi:CBS domain-containing protein
MRLPPEIVVLAFSSPVKQNTCLRKKKLAEYKNMTEGKNSPAAERRKCRDIMTRIVTTGTEDMTLKEVARLMRDGDMGSLPIVEGRKLAGIVTDRDIVIRAVAAGSAPTTKIGDVMTTQVFSVKADDFAFEAIRLMGDRQVRRIPVVNDEGELEGIIAIADVALETEDEKEIAETIEEISSGSAFWKKN